FCSTPKGRNWFWQLYQQGMNAAYPEWQSWRYPTGANPYIKETEIEAARHGMPERFFKQEYLAECLDDGGVVFRQVERVCVGEALTLDGRKALRPYEVSGESYYFGVDWGKDNDYTCVSVMTREGRQVWLERF